MILSDEEEYPEDSELSPNDSGGQIAIWRTHEPSIRESALERGMPQSEEAERFVLGTIILYEDMIAEAIELLKPDDFYSSTNQMIYVAMISLFERLIEITPIAVYNELKKKNLHEICGGISGLTNLSYGLYHVESIASYARIIRGKALVRRIIKVSFKNANEGLEEEDEPERILEHTIQNVLNLADETYEDRTALIGPVVDSLMVMAKESEGHGVLVLGITSGLIDLDEKLSGFQKQHLILLAARPGMGKSALATCIADRVAVGTELVVILFSLEMSKEELGIRILCSRAKVDSKRFKDGVLSKDEWVALGTASQELSNAKIILDDTFSMSPIKMRAKCRRVISKYKQLDLIIVDYVQLMGESGAHKKNGTREQDVSDISRELKGLCKDMNAPLLALAQLNRECEKRPNKRPMLSDLRESGALEQNADEVIFLYRDAYYQEMAGQPITDPFLAEINVAKSRSGGTGMVYARFERKHTRWDNLVKGQ